MLQLENQVGFLVATPCEAVMTALAAESRRRVAADLESEGTCSRRVTVICMSKASFWRKSAQRHFWKMTAFLLLSTYNQCPSY